MEKTKQKEIVYRGTIVGFSGSWGSGIATLIINHKPVMCENAPTVRALEACFGNIIASHKKNLKGKKIAFSLDAIGILEGFTPLDEFEGETEEY